MADITAETIDRILRLARPEFISLGDRQFSTNGLSAILEPVPNSLTVATLTGLVEYWQANFDALDPKPVIHVESHESVRLLSALFGPFEQRANYLHAKNINATNFRFGQYYDAENFIVALQSQFLANDDRSAILALLGNVKEEGVRQWSDDGVTQSITAKTGIALVKETPVPNPVVLKPFRTFLEIEQPESAFVLRVKSGKGEAPECSLYEAEGGQWKLEAITRIKAYLADKLPEATIIA